MQMLIIKPLTKVVNLVMIAFLLYFSFKIIDAVKNESEIVDSENSDFSLISFPNSFMLNKDSNSNFKFEKNEILCNNFLFMNAAFAFLLAGIINWKPILNTGVM